MSGECLQDKWSSGFKKTSITKSCLHETNVVFADLNVRKYSNQQMDTNFGRFEMLALRTIAGDEFKK